MIDVCLSSNYFADLTVSLMIENKCFSLIIFVFVILYLKCMFSVLVRQNEACSFCFGGSMKVYINFSGVSEIYSVYC